MKARATRKPAWAARPNGGQGSGPGFASRVAAIDPTYLINFTLLSNTVAMPLHRQVAERPFRAVSFRARRGISPLRQRRPRGFQGLRFVKSQQPQTFKIRRSGYLLPRVVRNFSALPNAISFAACWDSFPLSADQLVISR